MGIQEAGGLIHCYFARPCHLTASMPDASDFPALSSNSQHATNPTHPSSQTSYASQTQQSAAALAAGQVSSMRSPASGQAQAQGQTPGQTPTLPQPPPHLSHLQQQQQQAGLPAPPPGLGGLMGQSGRMANGEVNSKEEFPALSGPGKDVSVHEKCHCHQSATLTDSV